jgi:hypothetical protein
VVGWDSDSVTECTSVWHYLILAVGVLIHVLSPRLSMSMWIRHSVGQSCSSSVHSCPQLPHVHSSRKVNASSLSFCGSGVGASSSVGGSGDSESTSRPPSSASWLLFVSSSYRDLSKGFLFPMALANSSKYLDTIILVY